MKIAWKFFVVIFGISAVVAKSYAADDRISVKINGTDGKQMITQIISVPKTGKWSDIFDAFKRQANLDPELKVIVIRKSHTPKACGAPVVPYKPKDAYDFDRVPCSDISAYIHSSSVDSNTADEISTWLREEGKKS